MDEIKLQLENICLISILTGIVGAVIPQGKMKKAFSAFCSVVLIFSIISPASDLVKGGVQLLLPDADYEGEMLMADTEEAQTDIYEEVLAKSIEGKLEEAGFNVAVEVDCEKDADEIKVLGFILKGMLDEAERAEAETYLKNIFSEATVKFKEGEYD